MIAAGIDKINMNIIHNALYSVSFFIMSISILIQNINAIIITKIAIKKYGSLQATAFPLSVHDRDEFCMLFGVYDY